MSKERATAISIRGNRVFIRAVNAFAEDQGTTTADLVRDTLDEKFGDKLRPYIDAFAALDGQSTVHSDSQRSETSND